MAVLTRKDELLNFKYSLHFGVTLLIIFLSIFYYFLCLLFLFFALYFVNLEYQ